MMLLEQQRARYALNRVRAMANADRRQKDRYLTLVQDAPAMILSNGLGQALAVLLADCQAGRNTHNNDASWFLYDHLSQWIIKHRGLYGNGNQQGGQQVAQLLDLVTNGSTEQYLTAQEEALAILVWLKRFAVAFLRQA